MSTTLSGVLAAGLLLGLPGDLCGLAERALPAAAANADSADVRNAKQPSETAEAPGSAASDEDGAPQSTGSGEQPPAETTVRRIGAIEVVELGVSEVSLAEATQRELERAEQRGQTLIVMLGRAKCRPCRALKQSLSDPQMQVALDGVRMMGVDLEVFQEEIDSLGWPRDVYPAFLLMGADATPTDSIHAGEWGQDIAANIAPVLGPFVRGELTERRYPRAPTTGSLGL